MTLTLTQTESGQAAKTAPLPALIGRSEDADVHVECPWASRKHCQIEHLEGKFVLRDLGSRHGTIVNGQPVQETVLDLGDEIGVGLSCFVVTWVINELRLEHRSLVDSA